MPNNRMACVRVPGKLFIAGEYAVVEGGPAILVAVDRYLEVQIRESIQHGTVWSSQQPDVVVDWTRAAHQPILQEGHDYALVEAAMQITESYLAECGQAIKGYYALRITSELDDAVTGTKYGLGSSGAVTIAVIKAIMAYAAYPVTPEIVYRLGVLAQMRLGYKGSFGDLAASSFGGWVAYRRPQSAWLERQLSNHSISALVSQTWPDLFITPLCLPASLDLMVGWTKTVARTEALVGQMASEIKQVDKAEAHQQFLVKSQACLEDLISAFEIGNVPAIQAGIRHNRQLLVDYAQAMDLNIETPALTRLIDIARSQGAVAKTSGAGGGDCGICLVENHHQVQMIQRAWIEADILPLSVDVAPSQENSSEKGKKDESATTS